MIHSEILYEIIENPISGEWGKEGDGVNVIRTANFTNEGYIDFTNVVKRNVDPAKITKKRLLNGDLIIEKSGGSPTQPVGRVVYFNQEGDFICNNFTSVLRAKRDLVYPKYLHYILFANHKYGLTNRFQNKTTGIINLQLKRYIKETKIPLLPLEEQKKIAAILDAADAYRQKTKALIDKYDQLTQSLFLDMFGDPVNNPKGWEIEKLKNICQIIAGQSPPSDTYNQEQDGMPFFQGKADFGDLYPTVRYWCNAPKKLSKADDILFSLRAPVGPTNINNIDACIGRGLAAIRCENIQLKYLLHYLRGNEHKIAAFGTGSTFKAITIGTLKDLEIPLPAIELQNQFADRVVQIEKQKQQVEASLLKAEELFNSLLQKAFKGELTSLT